MPPPSEDAIMDTIAAVDDGQGCDPVCTESVRVTFASLLRYRMYDN